MDDKEPKLLLKPGDVVIDTTNNESGLLLERFNLFDDIIEAVYEIPDIKAWKILWAGKSYPKNVSRTVVYTEEGLCNMILEGLLSLHKNN